MEMRHLVAMSAIIGVFITGATFLTNRQEGIRSEINEQDRLRLASIRIFIDLIPDIAKTEEEKERFGVLALNLTHDREKDYRKIINGITERLSNDEADPKNRVTETQQIDEGWVYLGEFNKSEGIWQTQYVSLDEHQLPKGLTAGSSFTVRSSGLNVRKGMVTSNGEFPEVIDVIKRGTELKILEAKEWYSTGYWWARVSY